MARGHYQNAMVTLKRIADDNGKPLPLGHLIMSGSSLKRTHPTEVKLASIEVKQASSIVYKQYNRIVLIDLLCLVSFCF